MRSRRATIISVSLGVAVLIVATVAAIQWRSASQKTTAVGYFANANGIFVGDEVRILGVAVGSIDKIEPQPDAAKITFSFDAQYPVPADARAAILSPSLVTARALQLAPAYTGGPKMAGGAVIPRDRTAVPVEWDELKAQLEKLTDSLQPTTPGGPNSFGELINTAADNLRGEGDDARDTLIKLSQATSVLGDHTTDIFSTVRNTQLLVSGLRSSSDLLADFNDNLAGITSILSNSPDEVADATVTLDGAVTDLRVFIADNGEALGVTLDRLASITTMLNDSRGELKQILHIAPTLMSNFPNAYQPAQGALTGALAFTNFANPTDFICSAIQAASRENHEQAAKLCTQYLYPLIKDRGKNFLPLGFNPIVGAVARPNEITYSEDWLRPGAPPPGVQPPQDQGPLAVGTPLPAETLAPAGASPSPTPTDPSEGLQGLLVPGGTP